MSRKTYDVGYSHQHQYKGGAIAPRRHVVEPVRSDDGTHAVTEEGLKKWTLLCTGHPGTREYKGWADAVTCRDCRNKIGAADE